MHLQKARINLLEEQQQRKQQQQYRYGKKLNVSSDAAEASNEVAAKFAINDQNIALHQCINELASTLDEHKKSLMPTAESGGSLSPKVLRKKVNKPPTVTATATATSTSSANFVTVIEVKENKSTTALNKNKSVHTHIEDEGGNADEENNLSTEAEVYLVEDDEVSRTTTKFSTFEKKANDIASTGKLRSNVAPPPPADSSKKKMPPR